MGSLPARGGLTNGNGRTNGGGLTNGGAARGRTNGNGFTNGSGRTNGSGLTNGSGRTNGNGPEARVAAKLKAVHARRVRRKLLSAAVVLTLVAGGALTALGFAAASSTPAVDGRFVEWDGASPVSASNAVGLVALEFQPMKGGVEGYLAFASPLFQGRSDVWVFIDEDASADTGYFGGSVGADSAVRIFGDHGRVLGATPLRFAGGDRFDLNALVPSGSGRAAMDGGRIEFHAPALPASLAVAVALANSASSTGALGPDGSTRLASGPTGAPLSGEVRNGIRIDGAFEDWVAAPMVADGEEPLPARLDIAKAAAVGDDASAQFYLEARAGILSGTLPLRAEPIGGSAAELNAAPAPARRVAGTDLFELYLDTDLNALTGAPVGGIGADLLLRVEGVSGIVLSTQLYTFATGSGWTKSAALCEAAAGGSKLEASVVVAGLVGARAKFVLSGFEGLRDTNDQPVEVSRQAGALTGTALPPVPTTRAEPLAHGVPEIGDVAAVASGVLAITFLMRRRRSRAEVGCVPDADR